MKSLKDFIYESLDTELNEGVAVETVVKDKKSGDDITIIGKPFTTDRDERYIMAKEYIKKNHLKIDIDLKDAIKAYKDKADEVEDWVFVKAPNSVHVIDADLLDIPSELYESKENDVYAVIDFTDAIQGIFPTREEAEDMIKQMPDDAEAKVKKMKKSEIEDKEP